MSQNCMHMCAHTYRACAPSLSLSLSLTDSSPVCPSTTFSAFPLFFRSLLYLPYLCHFIVCVYTGLYIALFVRLSLWPCLSVIVDAACPWCLVCGFVCPLETDKNNADRQPSKAHHLGQTKRPRENRRANGNMD